VEEEGIIVKQKVRKKVLELMGWNYYYYDNTPDTPTSWSYHFTVGCLGNVESGIAGRFYCMFSYVLDRYLPAHTP
jgi:hypothetical protein